MDVQTTMEHLLLRLGQTPQEVAATLKAMGVKGVRNTIRHLNPIVRFTQRQLRIDDYRLAVAHGDGVPYLLRLTLPDGATQETAFPEPVKAFLDDFNAGAYPDMELPAD